MRQLSFNVAIPSDPPIARRVLGRPARITWSLVMITKDPLIHFARPRLPFVVVCSQSPIHSLASSCSYHHPPQRAEICRRQVMTLLMDASWSGYTRRILAFSRKHVVHWPENHLHLLDHRDKLDAKRSHRFNV